MPFSIHDLKYEKDSKERMPWEHYPEQYDKADPEGNCIHVFHFLMTKRRTGN